jgi:tRNA-(ms[2]io[6]A)-hydroxylase
MTESTHFALLVATPADWADTVLTDFNSFLLDHASCEKKASSMAMTFIAHYPDRTELVRAMTDLAIEELCHYREVIKLALERGLQPTKDYKDRYVIEFFTATRKGSDAYFMDRLLIAAIIEARGHERFGLVAEALPAGSLKNFYRAITTSEARHLDLFVELALRYFPADQVLPRLKELLTIEATIIANLPHRAALH